MYGDTRCKKIDISMFKRCFSAFWIEKGKICKNTSAYLFYIGCRYSLFFLQGEINCWGGRDRKNIGPNISPVEG